MLIALGRQLIATIAVIALVGVSAMIWPLDALGPERQLANAGAKLCYANDETLLVGAVIEGEGIGDDLVIAASRVPSLQRLSLSDASVTKRGIESLKALTKLTSLNLSRTRWTVETLDVIAGFESLRELRLEGCEWLRDEQLATLASLKNLEVLSLAGTPITTGGFEHLARLPKLRYVVLDRCPRISDASIESLIRLCEPRHLNISLSGTEMTQAGLVQLRKALPRSAVHLSPDTMVGLRAIGGRGQFITNDAGEVWGFRRKMDIDGQVNPLCPGDLAVVHTISSLTELNLERSNVDDAMLAELQQLPRLETLRLTSTGITDEGLRILEGFPNLRTFWLMENEIDGPGLQYFCCVPHLANLKLQTRQGDEVLSHLSHFDELRMLTICASLTNEGMDQLARLPALRYLALLGTEVRGPGIRKLAVNSMLTELRFDGGMLDDSDIDALAEHPSLKWLVLSQTRVTREGRDRLRKLRPDMSVNWLDSP